MSRAYKNKSVSESETSSPRCEVFSQRQDLSMRGENLLTAREVLSQLHESAKELIETVTHFTKSLLAAELEISPSVLSMKLSATDDRRIQPEEAGKLLKLTRKHPRIILASAEKLEEVMERYLSQAYGKGVDHDSY